MSEFRLNPDSLLSSIHSQHAKTNRGRLFIFFGMAAGVGKTYAMLQAAHQRLKEGVDVVVGVVVTHGRQETESLIADLPIISQKIVEYLGKSFEEMDLETILVRQPQLVLVDELAHHNIPGGRHPKRWQDVIELLEAGIDVFTTLNVQHIESRKDAVEDILGINVQETIPDSVLERAYEVRLIDLTPEELLKRLKEGKVYLGEKGKIASQNFFQLDRLTALREIALRLTAEKVDSDLQGLTIFNHKTQSWKVNDRLMVAVSHSPHSRTLIRSARRLAFTLDAPWIAVHVDTGKLLSSAERDHLSSNLAFAKELGAEIMTTVDPDIASALVRIAVQKNVTQLILGRPRWTPWNRYLHTLPDRLMRDAVHLNIHVLPQEKSLGGSRSIFKPLFTTHAPMWTYGIIFLVIGIVSLLNAMLIPFFGYRAVGYVFLLTVLGIGLKASFGPILFSAALSALAWNFFFIPPFHTFQITRAEDAMLIFFYFVAAVITGTLTFKIRTRERLLRIREESAHTLYLIAQAIATSATPQSCMDTVSQLLSTLLKGQCHFFVDEFKELPIEIKENSKEYAVLKWVLANHRPAGWSTDTLPMASSLYMPLLASSGIVGVMSFRSLSFTALLREESDILSSVTQQMAVYFEREFFRKVSQQTERIKESEKLYQVILDCISHEIKTPLTSIMGVASLLDTQTHNNLTHELLYSSTRLSQIVDNLLDMSRLNSGLFSIKREWQDPLDLIQHCLQHHKQILSTHDVYLSAPDSLPLLNIDYLLLDHALGNLLRNAAFYSPEGSRITVSILIEGHQIRFVISDEGPGIPNELIPHIFDKFYRIPGSKPGGIGLGLPIAKRISELHNGILEIKNRPEGGSVFSIILPIDIQPKLPQEDL